MGKNVIPVAMACFRLPNRTKWNIFEADLLGYPSIKKKHSVSDSSVRGKSREENEETGLR